VRKRILNNPGLKLLSFILAVVLWLVVANIEDPVSSKQFKDVEVTITNESSLDSINKVYEVKSGATATFTVKGRRSVLDRLTYKDFNVIADLSHMSEVYSIPVEVTPKNSDLDIEVSKNMNTMVVALEDEVTSSFAVNVNTTGEPMDGYALGEKEVHPNLVDVSGPQSLIRKIKDVRINIDVDRAKDDVTEQCELHYYNGDDEELDAARIVCSYDSVDATVQVLPTKTVKVVVTTKGSLASGYSIESLNYEPQEITIAGEVETLSEISEIQIPDVDITGLDEDKEYSFKVADYVSGDVVLTDPEQKIMVTVKVGQIKSRTITLNKDQIDLAGGNAKYDYELADSTAVKVVLTGFEDVIGAVTATDLKPMVSVEDLSAGTYMLNVSVAELDGISTNVANKVSVTVKKTNDG
jgi:YbbR domain-containing protein